MPFVHLIHGVDSVSLLKEINKRAGNIKRRVDVLLQVYIAEEESKFGFEKTEITRLHAEEFFLNLQHVRIRGLMGMSTFTTNKKQVTKEFNGLKLFFDQVKPSFNEEFKILSMGMSGDYEIAIDNGSTMVRIGSTIFGARTQ